MSEFALYIVRDKGDSKPVDAALLTLFHAGGGGFTLSAIYRLKSPESGYKGGVKWYQNSSWDIWDTAKQFSGPKKIFGPL